MPRYWHDRKYLNKIEDEDFKEENRRILAAKKPYFMIYIYPALKKQYNDYIKATNKNAMREFQMTVDELMAIPQDERTARQTEFLTYYEYMMPVGRNDCVMNVICKKIENEFDSENIRDIRCGDFDYSILKSGAEYTNRQLQAIGKIYEEYSRRLKAYASAISTEKTNKEEVYFAMVELNREFEKECSIVVPDATVLCDILLDICYSKNSTKRFAWDICAHEIIKNLLRRNNGRISFPAQTPFDIGADIFTYAGMQFDTFTISITEGDDSNSDYSE